MILEIIIAGGAFIFVSCIKHFVDAQIQEENRYIQYGSGPYGYSTRVNPLLKTNGWKTMDEWKEVWKKEEEQKKEQKIKEEEQKKLIHTTKILRLDFIDDISYSILKFI